MDNINKVSLDDFLEAVNLICTNEEPIYKVPGTVIQVGFDMTTWYSSIEELENQLVNNPCARLTQEDIGRFEKLGCGFVGCVWGISNLIAMEGKDEYIDNLRTSIFYHFESFSFDWVKRELGDHISEDNIQPAYTDLYNILTSTSLSSSEASESLAGWINSYTPKFKQIL